jgi:hypothetical protein
MYASIVLKHFPLFFCERFLWALGQLLSVSKMSVSLYSIGALLCESFHSTKVLIFFSLQISVDMTKHEIAPTYFVWTNPAITGRPRWFPDGSVLIFAGSPS